MINLNIEDVSRELLRQGKLNKCSLEEAWNNYVNPAITKYFSLDKVLNHIEDMCLLGMIEERVKNDGEYRYTLEDLSRSNKRRRSM